MRYIEDLSLYIPVKRELMAIGMPVSVKSFLGMGKMIGGRKGDTRESFII